jgi:hypothetical protein
MCAVLALSAPEQQVELEAAGAPCLLQVQEGMVSSGPSSSKFRGLCWDRKHQSWRCRIFYASKVRAWAQEASAVYTRSTLCLVCQFCALGGAHEPAYTLCTIQMLV